jgi:Yip1 domain
MSTAPAFAAGESLSEPARIVNTFVAPSKAFADLKRVSRWWSPFILIVIASYTLVVVAGQRVGWEQLFENQMKMQPKQAARLENLPADQRPAAIERSVKLTRAISYAFPIAFQLPFLLIVAAVLMASFNFGAGAEIPFRTALAVVMYASLPGVLKALLAIVSLLVGANPESFSFQNPVATNPGYFLDPTASPALFRMASAVDAFIIWTLVLAAVGFAAVSKLKRGTTFAVVFGWYVVFTLGLTAIGLLFS